MRIYYCFKIKKEFLNLYKDTPSTLYNILNQLYYMRKSDINYGYNLFNQMVDPIDKDYIDKTLYIKMHTKMRYAKRKDEHIINNLYKDEVSIMKVRKTYILINSNKSCTEFFELLNEFNKELFICDFTNNDYFFISSIKMLV